MLKLRLDLLDSFLRPGSPNIQSYFAVGEIVLIDSADVRAGGVFVVRGTEGGEADVGGDEFTEIGEPFEELDVGADDDIGTMRAQPIGEEFFQAARG